MQSVWWSAVSGAAASPVGYVLIHSTPSLTSLRTAARASSGPLIKRIEPLHAELQVLGVPVHQSAGAADLAAAGGQARAGDQVFLDRLLEPDVDVVQAAAASGRRVAALESQLGVAGGQDRDVFDRVLDVEIGQLGDVEVGGVEVGLDQARHDRPAAGVDPQRVGRDRRCAPCRLRRRRSCRPSPPRSHPRRATDPVPSTRRPLAMQSDPWAVFMVWPSSILTPHDATSYAAHTCKDRPRRVPRAIGDRRNTGQPRPGRGSTPSP